MIHRMLVALLCLTGLSVQAAPVSLLPKEGVSALRLHHPPQLAEREMVEVEHPAFSRALRATVKEEPPHAHEIQFNQRNVVPVEAGDTVRIRAIVRSASPGGIPLRMHLFVQDVAKGYRALFNREMVIGPEWESVTYTFAVEEDFAPDRMQFSIFLGAQQQTVELGLLQVDKIGPGVELDTVPDQTRAISVQGEYLPIQTRKPEVITGVLPAGWEEDSAWADVEVHYRPQMNNPFGGERALRVEVKNVREGFVQYRIPNVAIAPSHLVRMRIPLRSEDTSSASLSLRKRGAPYTTYWQTPLTARPEWGVFEFLAVFNETDADATLMFTMTSVGTLEIGDFEMEYLTPDQILDARDFTGNLLPTSSFPLGLSAPWACGANGTTPEHLGADPSVKGPSGSPALRMVPHGYEGRPMMQITAPFIGKPGTIHTFSFWAKSDKPGVNASIRMGPPTEHLWRGDWHKNIQLTREWKRYEHSVLLPPAPDMLYLARITSHDEGTYWVDQVMVEVAEEAGPFQPVGPVELHAVATRDFGLSFEEEDMTYRIALTGDIGQAHRIEGTVLDLYGQETKLPALPVPTASGKLAELETHLSGIDQLGAFLVTHQAVDRDGNPLGAPAELLLHRVRQPRRWGEVAFDSAFGTHVANTPASVRMGKALGFNWNRLHYKFNWTGLQREDGSWRFDAADRAVELHDQERLLILTHFGGIPRPYSVVNENWDGANAWYRLTAAPRIDAMDEFEEYCYQMLAHAGHSLQAVEVWNEPFLHGFFVGNVQDGRPIREQPEVLIAMKQHARRAAERAGYDGMLLWNTGPHYGEGERTFDEAVRDLGGTEIVDGLSFHRYTGGNLAVPGDRFQQDLGVIREVFAGKDALHSIWNSEGGHGLSEIFNLYRQVPPDLRARANFQAAQYVRYYLANFAAGVDKVFIYTLYPQDSWTSNYGYMNVDGTLSQIAPATSAMTWYLEGKTFTEVRALSDTVFAHHYQGDTANTVVLLPSGRGAAELRLIPDGVEVGDLYGNAPQVPSVFSTTLLYLSAPGLTLDQAGQILNASHPSDLPRITLTPAPRTTPTPDPAPPRRFWEFWK